jgi:uncharacterized membrane protein
MSEILREAVLIAATLTTGLMAGVFGIYSNAIMPGLRRTDDRTFVAAFQSVDRATISVRCSTDGADVGCWRRTEGVLVGVVGWRTPP